MRQVLAAKAFLVLAMCFGFSTRAFGAVWDEPWHKEVVAGADSFGLFEVVSTTPFRTVFKKVRSLAGAATGDSLEVDGFYNGSPLSTSSVNGGFDDEWALHFDAGKSYYLFLKKAPSGGTWRIATPSAGYALIGTDGKVVATYRISLHLAVVDPKIYELTQTCIFLRLHGQEKCLPEVYKLIDEQAAIAPPVMIGNLAAGQLERFFMQHVALETAYLVGYPIPLDTLTKFLLNSSFHVQISGVRAIAASNVKDRNQALLMFVMDEKKNPVARIVAVRMIRELNARELKDKLIAYFPDASIEPAGLEINIMDSRVGTVFPSSVRDALTQLLSEWK